MILKYGREPWPVVFSFCFFYNCKALFFLMYMGPKGEGLVSILNEVSISCGIWYSSDLVTFTSPTLIWEIRISRMEDRIYFYNKFSDYWNVGMPAKVSALISRNLWLLAWKMKEDQPSAEPHSCGWAQASVLTIIKGNKCAQCLGSQSNPRMSSAAQFLNHQYCFFTLSLNISFSSMLPQEKWKLYSLNAENHASNFTYLNLVPMCLFLLHLFSDGSNYVSQAGFEELLHQLLESWITGV